MTSKNKALKGYKAGYDWKKARRFTTRTGLYKTKIDAMGHEAGYEWARQHKVKDEKRRGPHTRKYSKNSPSFDEGVHAYKYGTLFPKSKSKALSKVA